MSIQNSREGSYGGVAKGDRWKIAKQGGEDASLENERALGAFKLEDGIDQRNLNLLSCI